MNRTQAIMTIVVVFVAVTSPFIALGGVGGLAFGLRIIVDWLYMVGPLALILGIFIGCKALARRHKANKSVDAMATGRIQTCTLLVLSALFLLLAAMLSIGVVCLRPVKDATGAQVLRADGRILMETDTWGNIKVQWVSEVPLLLSLALFIWCIVRFVRWLHRRFHA